MKRGRSLDYSPSEFQHNVRSPVAKELRGADDLTCENFLNLHSTPTSRTWPLSRTLSHTAFYIDRVHGSRVDDSDSELKGGPHNVTKGRPHTHTQYTSSAVRRLCSGAPGASGFASPVAHRLASASPDRSLPESPLPPFPPSSFIVRVEVGRDRHAQKAGSGGRAVAIDSAAVTRVHIPMRELRPCAPRSQLRCCLGRGCSRDRL